MEFNFANAWRTVRGNGKISGMPFIGGVVMPSSAPLLPPCRAIKLEA